MRDVELEECPGCGARLPHHNGPTHRYIGASAACWAVFSDLFNAGQPPMAPVPTLTLLGDAYAAQHPGTPSAQAIQSVAVHVLTLYGVFVRGVEPTNALWVRQRALREHGRAKHERFHWLTPPLCTGSLTIVDIVQGSTALERATVAQHYIETVWTQWANLHVSSIARWYDAYVLANEVH